MVLIHTAFGAEDMDMRVPFEVAAISMKCDYKAGSQCGFLSFPFGFPF